MDCDQSICDATSRKGKLCKYLSCGCRRICSCKGIKSDEKYYDNSSKQYHSGAACYFPPYPSWTWIPMWFDNAEKAVEYSTIHRREMRIAHEKKNCNDSVGKHAFPTQSKRVYHDEITSLPDALILPPCYSVVGHPSFKIYRFQLPPRLLSLLDHIVDGCANYANSLPTGWKTHLYSLTKQDVALRDVPGMYDASRPIMHYIKRAIERMYEVDTVRFDRNQPHVLKYSAEDKSKHTGVELHHDKCDVTANIVLSRSNAYVGGGTYFPDAHTIVRMEYGEFILHPGNLVHGGVDITSGERYLMHIVPEMSIVIDDGIKASLATLDLVKYSYSSRVAEKALSDDEVESAHRSLNQIIQAAESIKQKLPSSFINEEIDVIALSSKLRRGSKRHDRSITEPSSEGMIAPSGSSVHNADEKTINGGVGVEDLPESKHNLIRINEGRDKCNNDIGHSDGDSGKSNDDIPPHRRLSTPCLMPMDAAGTGEGIGSNADRKKSILSLFNNGGKGTVHPQIGDIEAGGSRRAKFSKISEGSENSAIQMTSREAFRIIDENGDGFLQKEEVSRAIEMMCEHGEMDLDGLSPLELAEKMMSEVDVDGDGLVDMDEFTTMMEKTSSGLGKANSNTLRMSTLAKNVLIAHQKKLENSVIGHDMWLIHPLSDTHATWDILVSMLILLTVVTMPLCLGWEELNDSLYMLNLMVDFIFLVDVCKNFCTGYMDDNEIIIMSAKLVRKNYLSGFFVTDFCSSIPLDLILKSAGVDSVGSTITGTKQSLKMLKLLRMTKLFRLFRLNRLFLYLKRTVMFVEETLQFRISDGFTKLLRLCTGTMILAHWIGCFNFLLLRLHDFPPDSWLAYAGLTDKDPFTQWSWSFFKALSQMIMIGFQTPPFTSASCDTLSEWCAIEYWVTLGCLYVGAIFYSILISSISSILHSASQSTRQFDERLLQIDEYMRSKKLPAAMREKTKDYFYLKFSNGKLLNEAEILDLLSPVLRREIKQFTAKDICKKIPLLSNPSCKDFAQDISCVIEPSIMFANEVIMREGTTGEELFFISSGVVEIYVSAIKTTSYLTIGDGCYLGDVSVLLGVRRTASAKSTTQCTLYRLRKGALLSLLRDYPAIETKMNGVAQSRRRRLAHYLHPTSVALAPGDEIDVEDSKTELFGQDTDRILQDKEKATELDRIHSGIKPKRRHALPST